MFTTCTKYINHQKNGRLMFAYWKKYESVSYLFSCMLEDYIFCNIYFFVLFFQNLSQNVPLTELFSNWSLTLKNWFMSEKRGTYCDQFRENLGDTLPISKSNMWINNTRYCWYSWNPQTNRQTFGFGPLPITVFFFFFLPTKSWKTYPQKLLIIGPNLF